MEDALALHVAEPRAPNLRSDFWALPRGRASAAHAGAALRTLVDRVNDSQVVALFDAVESGVPTSLVEVIAQAMGETSSAVMEMIGVSPTTLRRKDEAGEPLPDVAGHRVMALLRLLADLRRMLAESGDAQRLRDFNLEAWAARWLREPQADLGGRTPAVMLRNPEGQRAVQQLIERMRGGLPA